MTAEVRRYWDRVAALGCLICRQPAEIAHCHGGSMIPVMGPHAKGKKLARFDWLVLPLCPQHGREQFGGLDANVAAWEATHGTQLDHLQILFAKLGVNIWQKADVWDKVEAEYVSEKIQFGRGLSIPYDG